MQATVSAFSRAADAKLAARGRLAAELAELEAAMRAMEEDEERVRYQHRQSQQQQQQQPPQQPQQQQQQQRSKEEEGEEAEEGDWDEWMDQFVVAATAAPPAAAHDFSATRALQQPHLQGAARHRQQGKGAHSGDEGEQDVGSEWEDSFEGGAEESEEDGVGPLGGHLQGTGRAGRTSTAGVAKGAGSSSRGSVVGGAREGSIASSYWRDERADRRDTLDVIDQRFEHIALQYEVRAHMQPHSTCERVGGREGGWVAVQVRICVCVYEGMYNSMYMLCEHMMVCVCVSVCACVHVGQGSQHICGAHSCLMWIGAFGLSRC